MKNSNTELELLLHLLDEAYQRKTWHGPNLRGSLRGLTAEEAAWRPGTNRHNIWEIAVHCAYWKYTVRRRLLDEKRGSFPLKGSNWFKRPIDLSDRAWKEDLRLLDETHRSLRDAVENFPASQLHLRTAQSKYPNIFVIYGVANHDIYHAGQIQLLKRLQVEST
jgi:uncharacterized damage-inducible protein DinB